MPIRHFTMGVSEGASCYLSRLKTLPWNLIGANAICDGNDFGWPRETGGRYSK